MKAQPAFEKTPESVHFTEVMKKLILVPKSELDQAMKDYEERSKKRLASVGRKRQSHSNTVGGPLF